jgi:hypothetical protein
MRIADWRNRYARIPLETTTKPFGYVPIPRYRALVVVS